MGKKLNKETTKTNYYLCTTKYNEKEMECVLYFVLVRSFVAIENELAMYYTDRQVLLFFPSFRRDVFSPKEFFVFREIASRRKMIQFKGEQLFYYSEDKKQREKSNKITSLRHI